MINNKILDSYLENTINNLSLVKENNVVSESSFTIKCSDLEYCNQTNIYEFECYRQYFEPLQKVKGPTLYWLEIISPTYTKDVVNAISKYKDSLESKVTPAIKKNVNYDSKVLYVGKVKRHFWGRIIQHLGFWGTKKTQGLQLYHWAKDIKLELKVNYIEFDNNMENIISDIEYTFARELTPLIGKHK